MAEQESGLFQQTELPESPQKVFHTQLMGFHRDEVLQYIEKILSSHASRVHTLQVRLDCLQHELEQSREESSALVRAAGGARQEIEQYKKRAKKAEKEKQEIQDRMNAEHEAKQMVEQELKSLQFENRLLKKDNQALHKEIERLDCDLLRRDSEMTQLNEALVQANQMIDRRMKQVCGAQQQAQQMVAQAQQQASLQLAQAQHLAHDRAAAQTQLEQQANEVTKQLADMKDRLLEADEQVAQASKQLQDASAHFTQSLKHADSHMQCVERLLSDLQHEAQARRMKQCSAQHQEKLLDAPQAAAHTAQEAALTQTAAHQPVAQPFRVLEAGAPYMPYAVAPTGGAEQCGSVGHGYVPRPTPVGRIPSFSQPYETSVQQAAAAGEQWQMPVPIAQPQVVMSSVAQTSENVAETEELSQTPAQKLLKTLREMLKEPYL